MLGGAGLPAYPYGGTIAGASRVGIESGAGSGSDPGHRYFIYDAPFKLACASQAASSSIVVHMFADNTAGAFLNGVPIGSPNHLPYPSPGNGENWGPPGPSGGWAFTSTAGFVPGENVVQIVVLNEGGFTAVDFSATITSPPCETEYPGIGRCLPLTGGLYKNAVCTKPATSKATEKYEWYAGAVKNHYASKGGKSGIDAPSGEIQCTPVLDAGEYIGESEDLDTLTFTHCAGYGALQTGGCHSASAAAGEVKTELLRSLYGFVNGPTEGGVSLEPASGNTFAAFERGTVPAVVRGSAIAPLTPVNKMTKKFTEDFFTSSGFKQRPEKFQPGALDILESSINSGLWEQSALIAPGTIVTNEESLELRLEP